MNALVREVVDKIFAKDYSVTITEALIDKASDNLMKRWDIHIDYLLSYLLKPRVKWIVETMLGAPEVNSRNYEKGRIEIKKDLRFLYGSWANKT
ncbi:MAG: hypothetical protein LBD17_01600 [Endomicrobium sp.]|nr:hypothetical protein [Endomicrobium sp.]